MVRNRLWTNFSIASGCDPFFGLAGFHIDDFTDLLFLIIDKTIDVGKKLFFLIGRKQHIGYRHGPVPWNLSGFVDVVEETVHLVIVLLRDGIVLVVMALGTGHGKSQKAFAHNVGPIGHVFGTEFLVDNSSLQVLRM